METNSLLLRLVQIYKGEKIRHPKLRTVTLAQWILESGWATSDLAKQHYNFGGLKWRSEMAGYATKISYTAHDGTDYYCKFATIENFLNGYWAFLNRTPYTGWESTASDPAKFIKFIGPIYTPKPGYAEAVLNLVPDAERLLDNAEEQQRTQKVIGNANLGVIVIDPGHGGSSNVSGSSANNAISVSGVKEKKLTLDFSLILREQLLSQAQTAKDKLEVVLTRTTDVNLTGKARAGLAFEKSAKLFLCLHFNGSSDKKIRGPETFYRAQTNGNLNLDDDIEFANAVHEALYDAIKAIDSSTPNRGVKPDTQSGPGSLGVLNDKYLGNDRMRRLCRSAYVEVEYITHPKVEDYFISGANAVSNRTKLMASVAKAMLAYLRRIP